MILARLDEVQEELLYYPPTSGAASALASTGASALAKCYSFYIKVFWQRQRWRPRGRLH